MLLVRTVQTQSRILQISCATSIHLYNSSKQSWKFWTLQISSVMSTHCAWNIRSTKLRKFGNNQKFCSLICNKVYCKICTVTGSLCFFVFNMEAMNELADGCATCRSTVIIQSLHHAAHGDVAINEKFDNNKVYFIKILQLHHVCKYHTVFLMWHE